MPLSAEEPELYLALSLSRSRSPLLGLVFAPLAPRCLSLTLRGLFSGDGDGAGDDFALSLGTLLGVRGSSSVGGGAARAPGGRLNAGRVSALAAESRRGFGMQVVVSVSSYH